MNESLSMSRPLDPKVGIKSRVKASRLDEGENLVVVNRIQVSNGENLVVVSETLNLTFGKFLNN